MTALLFDVGNTRLKWGIANDGELRRTGSISHARLAESGFTPLTTRLPTQVDTVLASNVAGQNFATRLSGVIGLHCGSDVHFARTTGRAHGVTNSYRRPRRLGVDRWVAMIGAYAEFRSALCVVDAGTAVTIDAVDRSGRHLGGQILPGLRLMTTALDTDTSDLPAVRRAPAKGTEPHEQFATSTNSAIYYGALGAVCGAIERAVKGLKAERLRPKIVLTGGDASRILNELEGKIAHRPHLVLQGLAVMANDKQ
ncbi:MAG: type III pantothenate kinase [Woeseiaceae bacterium]|nr:type III pantothenate kinase [Woeseiaceae bacterium]